MTREDRAAVVFLVGTFLVHQSMCTDMELWRSFCPLNNYCTTEGQDVTLNGRNTSSKYCCYTCSCDHDCWVFKNCCPDVTHNKPDDLQEARCIHTLINQNFDEFISYDDINLYEMVNFCPRDYDVTKQDVIDQCNGRITDNTDLDDVVAVTDDKGRNYRNKHCAMCHGVHNVESWDLLLIGCREDMMSKTILSSRYLPTLFTKCVLESVPTKRMDKYRSLWTCKDDPLGMCPSPGQVRADIRNECLHGPTVPFTVPTKVKGFAYKNVFCFMCDVNINDTLYDECPSTHNPGRYTNPKFSVILLDKSVVTKVPDISAVTSHPGCSETEMYDHVKKICRSLYCPQFNILSRGRCLKIGTVKAGYLIRLRIHYEPLDDVTLPDTDTIPDRMTTEQDILYTYGLNKCIVQDFILDAFVEKSSHRLQFVRIYAELVITEMCTMEAIVEFFRDRPSENNISFVTRTTEVKLTGRLDFNTEPFEYDRERIVEMKLMSHMVFDEPAPVDHESTTKYVQGFFLCPFFLLTDEEYETIVTEVFEERNGTEMTDHTRTEDGFYALSQHTFAICVDTYFGLYTENGGRSNITGTVACLAEVLIVYMMKRLFTVVGQI